MLFVSKRKLIEYMYTYKNKGSKIPHVLALFSSNRLSFQYQAHMAVAQNDEKIKQESGH